MKRGWFKLQKNKSYYISSQFNLIGFNKDKENYTKIKLSWKTVKCFVCLFTPDFSPSRVHFR